MKALPPVILVLCSFSLLVFFQNFSVPDPLAPVDEAPPLANFLPTPTSISYSQFLMNYGKRRIDLLTAEFKKPFPPVEAPTLFWGSMNQNIAGMLLKKNFDPARISKTLTGLNEEYEACSKAVTLQDCGDLTYSLLLRMYALSINQPEGAAYRMPQEIENKINDYFFMVLNKGVLQIDVQPISVTSDAWKITNDSENHLFSIEQMLLLASQYLRANPGYANRFLANGLTPATMYPRYVKHWQLLLTERLRRGLLIEANANKYSKYTWPVLVNLTDLPDDAMVRAQARDLMDLVIAHAATETLGNGVRIGSQSRKEPNQTTGSTPVYNLYMRDTLSGVLDQTTMVHVASSYFPPQPIWELGAPVNRTNSYELAARIPGALVPGSVSDIDPSQSVFRTTYVTPNFILASSTVDLNHSSYAAISAEARSMVLGVNEGTGVIAQSAPLMTFEPGLGQCFDKAIGVQKKNVLIFQNNFDFFSRGYRSDGDLSSTIACNGDHLIGLQRILKSSRRDSRGQLVTVDFVEADQKFWGDPNSPTGTDRSRAMADIEYSSSFHVDESNHEHGVFFRSPEGSTFIWVKPVASDYSLLAGYSGSAQRSDSTPTRELRLTQDKFSPVIVVATPAANYNGSFDNFVREMSLTPISYSGNRVGYRQPLRSSLESWDVFVDSDQAVISAGAPLAVTDPQAHNAHLIRTTTKDDAFQLNFTLPRSGTYHFKARVRGRSGSSDSFLVSVDGQPAVSWQFHHQSPELLWLDIPLGVQAANAVQLGAGVHSIQLKNREIGAEFDALVAMYERNGEPATVEFQELIDRNQPDSTINGLSTRNSYYHNLYTFYSPFVVSPRDSGLWDVHYGNHRLRVDANHPSPVRHEGIALAVDTATTVGGVPIQTDVDGTQFVTLQIGTQLTYTVHVDAAGVYNLDVRTRAADGSQDSFKLSVNGSPPIAAKIPQGGVWTWDLLHAQSSVAPSELIPLSLNAGTNTITISTREPGAQISELIVERQDGSR